jgi:hypothetical protein
MTATTHRGGETSARREPDLAVVRPFPLRGRTVSRRRYFQVFDDSTEKRCGRCGELRPLGEFVRDATKRVGSGSICRECDREKARAWYDANREKKLAYMAARKKG